MIGYVIGDSDMLTGFRLVGIEGEEVASIDEARRALSSALGRSDIGIILVSEAFLADPSLRNEVDKIRQERITPLIVGVPGSKGPASTAQLSDIISKILGVKM